jgi:hypothetical protein
MPLSRSRGLRAGSCHERQAPAGLAEGRVVAGVPLVDEPLYVGILPSGKSIVPVPRPLPYLAGQRWADAKPGFHCRANHTGFVYGGRVFCPGGAIENSPAIYRWERNSARPHPVREGRLNPASVASFSRSSGTIGLLPFPPSDKSLGYCQKSLRDKPRHFQCHVSETKIPLCRQPNSLGQTQLCIALGQRSLSELPPA